MKFDLHVHTNASTDSSQPVDMAIAAAKKAGLDGIAVTNHNTLTYSSLEDFILIPACEYTTDGGHLLTYFINSPLDAGLTQDEKGRYPWREIVRRAHEMGGLVFIAHPCAPMIERDEEIFSQVDGLEGYNARILHSRGSKGANSRARELARKYNLPLSAGSDGHYSGEVGAAYFECDVASSNNEDKLSEIKSALKSGRGKIYGGRASAFWRLCSAWCKTRRTREWGRIPRLIPRTARWLLLSLRPKKTPEYIDAAGGKL